MRLEAKEDAYGMIARCGLEKATISHSGVVVVGEDVDLIVFLMVLTPPNVTIHFMKLGRKEVQKTNCSRIQS